MGWGGLSSSKGCALPVPCFVYLFMFVILVEPRAPRIHIFFRVGGGQPLVCTRNPSNMMLRGKKRLARKPATVVNICGGLLD